MPQGSGVNSEVDRGGGEMKSSVCSKIMISKSSGPSRSARGALLIDDHSVPN